MAGNQEHKLCMVPGRKDAQHYSKRNNYHVTYITIYIIGPIEFHEDVLTALSTPSQSHVSPDFIPVFGECFGLLRKLLFTDKGQPFIVAGSGTLGWDMVASNLVEQGEDALVLNSGYFGDSFTTW